MSTDEILLTMVEEELEILALRFETGSVPVSPNMKLLRDLLECRTLLGNRVARERYEALVSELGVQVSHVG